MPMEQVNSAIEAGSKDWIWMLDIEGVMCPRGICPGAIYGWVVYLIMSTGKLCWLMYVRVCGRGELLRNQSEPRCHNSTQSQCKGTHSYHSKVFVPFNGLDKILSGIYVLGEYV